MGMGMLSGLQLSFAFDRSGSQLGGVNVRVLGLFSNSFPHSQNRPFVTFRQCDLIPFTLPYRRKGGNNAHPHSSHCMLWCTSKHLPTLFCSNPFTQSHVVKYSSPYPIYAVVLPLHSPPPLPSCRPFVTSSRSSRSDITWYTPFFHFLRSVPTLLPPVIVPPVPPLAFPVPPPVIVVTASSSPSRLSCSLSLHPLSAFPLPSSLPPSSLVLSSALLFFSLSPSPSSFSPSSMFLSASRSLPPDPLPSLPSQLELSIP